jgi:hypothetical protein
LLPEIASVSAWSSALFATATIFPSRMKSAPFSIRGPAAVKIVTFLINVGRDGKGLYVLGKGSAFGVDSAPGPGKARALSADARAGVGACEPDCFDDAQPAAPMASAIAATRRA